MTRCPTCHHELSRDHIGARAVLLCDQCNTVHPDAPEPLEPRPRKDIDD